MKRFWNWGVVVATVYTIFAAATLSFATFAMNQPVDLVSPEYYAQAMDHDTRQAAASRAMGLGSAFRIEVADDGQAASVTWPNRARPTSGRVRLYRPSNSSADRTEPVNPDGNGHQRVALAGLAAGSWIVQCEWIAGGQTYYAERHIVVR